MRGTPSTPSNIILSRKIHAFQRSASTFDVTALWQEMQFLQRRVSSVRVTVLCLLVYVPFSVLPLIELSAFEAQKEFFNET